MSRDRSPQRVATQHKLQKCTTRKTTIMAQIDEINGKMKIKDRQWCLIKERDDNERAANEKKIVEMRRINFNLCRSVQHAFNMQKKTMEDILSGKRDQMLALRGTTLEGAVKAVDQVICGTLARKYCELKHERKKREDQLAKLRKKAYTDRETILNTPPCEAASITNTKQLENSISNVKLKMASAMRMHGVYTKIKQSIEDKLRSYPKILNDVEKKIYIQRTELHNLMELKKESFKERDLALRRKANLETTVREERRGREASIRAIRNRVRDPITSEMPHTRTKLPNYRDVDRKNSGKALENVQREIKMKEYEKYAAMLEVVTGVSFHNPETLIECFRIQKNSSALLRKQLSKKRKVLLAKKSELKKHKDTLKELMFVDEEMKNLEVISMENSISHELQKKEDLVADHTDIVMVLDEVESWLRLVVMRLISSLPKDKILTVSPLVVKGGDSDVLKSLKELGPPELFHILSDLLLCLHSDHSDTGVITIRFEHPVGRKEDESALINENNNRILPTLEKKVSEEFEYNTPNNEEYRSRETIKRQSVFVKQRGNA